MPTIPSRLLYGQDTLMDKVSRVIAPGDGMFANGNEIHYFSVGAIALAVINQSLDAARKSKKEIKRILGYACGFGRVLRWLQASFPHSYILGADVNPKAIAGANFATGVDTQQIDLEFINILGEPFDLIWVGSLITHLPENDVILTLKYLRRNLANNGVIVFTSHGRQVEKWLVKGERNYNLDNDRVIKLLDMLKKRKYGFQSYKNRSDFGISVSYTSRMNSLIEHCDLETFYFRSEGWDNHQDVFACRKPISGE